MDEKNEDLGWQKPGDARKFHYFVQELAQDNGQVNNWQRSLCGRYGTPVLGYMEQDLLAPGGDCCAECSRRWVKAYGR